jgi:xylulokinase
MRQRGRALPGSLRPECDGPLQTSSACLLRATYEGIALGIRQILELLADAVGTPTRTVAVGGGTSSELWLQIVSDVTGITQSVPEETIGACYGDALLAAIGVGLVPPNTDWSRTVRTVEPNATSKEIYDQHFFLYSDLYAETAGTVHKLAALATPPSETPARVHP